jgi:hypothetical protein
MVEKAVLCTLLGIEILKKTIAEPKGAEIFLKRWD